MLDIIGEAVELIYLGIAIEFVGLVLVLIDGVLRFRQGIFKIENASASIKELSDADSGRVTEQAQVERSPGSTQYSDVQTMKANVAALAALTSSTQLDVERLDQQLQQLVDARFSQALAVARSEADDVRRELNDDLRRTAWRPVLGTLLAICGVLLSAAAQVASTGATQSPEPATSPSGVGSPVRFSPAAVLKHADASCVPKAALARCDWRG